MGCSAWGRRDLDMTEQQLSVSMHRYTRVKQTLTLLPPIVISLFLLLNLANF